MTSAPDRSPMRHAVGVFALALLGAVAARLGLWIGTMWVPIPNEARQPISPLHANSAIDLAFYQMSRAIYGEWIDRFTAAPWAEWGVLFTALLTFMKANFISGPFMAGLLELFDYDASNTLPLATLYLALSSLVVVAWLRWFTRIQAGGTALLIVALIPGPLWYMLNVSSDLPFAALFALFFFAFFSARRMRQRYVWGAIIALVATLLRPHGISMFLFMGLYAALLSPARSRGQKIAIAALLAATGMALFVLFNAYFGGYLRSSATLTYFGYPQADYVDGLLPALPDGINQLVSWIALGGAKLVYLAGLRPSYGKTELVLVLIRAAPGLILLPGLLYGLLRAPWAYRLLLAAFCAPVALGAAQDRYLLAVTPLLVLFAIRAAREAQGWMTGRRPVFAPLPLQ